jgi:hypothetical protein
MSNLKKRPYKEPELFRFGKKNKNLIVWGGDATVNPTRSVFCSLCRSKIPLTHYVDEITNTTLTNHRCKYMDLDQDKLNVIVEYKLVKKKYSINGYLLPDRQRNTKIAIINVTPERNVHPKSETAIPHLINIGVYRKGTCKNCGCRIIRTDYGWLHWHQKRCEAGMQCLNEGCHCKSPELIPKGHVFRKSELPNATKPQTSDPKLLESNTSGICSRCNHAIKVWDDKWWHCQYGATSKQCRYEEYNQTECKCTFPAPKAGSIKKP